MSVFAGEVVEAMPDSAFPFPALARPEACPALAGAPVTERERALWAWCDNQARLIADRRWRAGQC